jgi:hypothetical protein
VRVAEKFSQDERVPNSPVCFIYYMLSNAGQTCALFSVFDKPSTCSHSDDSGGTAVFVPPRTPRSSGYDFLCTYGLCCYMLYVYYVITCYVSISEPSSGNSDSVWIYRRDIFGKQNCLYERTP